MSATEGLRRPAPQPARRSPTSDGRRVAVVVLGLATAAWAWLLLGPLPGPHGHGGATEHHGGPVPVSPLVWYTGWLVMVVAMMLPPALPLLRVTARLARRLPRPGVLVTTGAVAFVAVWAATGLVLLLASSVGRAVLADGPDVEPAVAGGAAAALAAAYQLSPLKRACLTGCRSPLALAMTTWTGTRAPILEAALLGVRYGALCVGCCWALMLLTVLTSVAALPVMVVAGVLMAAERLLPRTRVVVPAVAVVALVWGALLVAVVSLPGAA